MGKTRYLLKKIRDIKGICHAKVGTIKDRNSMDLTEEYTEEIHRKILMTQIATMVWSLT